MEFYQPYFSDSLETVLSKLTAPGRASRFNSMEPAGVFEECLHEMYGPVRVFEWSAQDSESKQPRLLRDFNLKSDSSQQPRISLLYTGPGQYSALRPGSATAASASAALPIDVSGFCCFAVLCCALLASHFQVKPTHRLHPTTDKLSRHAYTLLCLHRMSK